MPKENPKPHQNPKKKILDRPLSQIFSLPRIFRRTRQLPLEGNTAELERLANKGTFSHDQAADRLGEVRRNITPPAGKNFSIETNNKPTE